MSDLAEKTRSGLKWSAIERIITQTIQLGITLVLARMLGPEAFGLIGMLAVFIAISNVFIDSGFTSALIRKLDCDENDLTTAFFYNIFVSVLCYSILYVSSPFISIFFHQPDLQALLRALGANVVINAFTLIPRVVLTSKMKFDVLAKASVISAVLSGVLAIFIAQQNFGPWALVTQSLVNTTCCALLLSFFFPWWPRGAINKKSFSYLFGFGSKLLFASLLDVLYSNVYTVIIGKKFIPSVVGHYTQANQLSSIPAMTLTGIIQRVTYPMLAQLQDDKCSMAQAYRLTLRISAVVVFPLLVGLAIISQPLLVFILGAEWRSAAIMLSVLCFGYMLYPIHAINLNLLQVKGRSDLFLKLEIMKKALGVGILLISIPFGVLSMCVGVTIASYLSLVINCFYTEKITEISQWEQYRDVMPIWLAVIASAAIAYCIGINFSVYPLVEILTSLSIAMIIYSGYLLLWQKDVLSHLLKCSHR